ncbi:diguanylate cyclase domain-containing protein [Actinoplanes sp. NPDC049265]|uniref:diguanylate cyclase domain-containing protein n=1 Tax=Actinoplanes sp. NPDC049265 TaxID=3363902 RepID=UPI0037186A28
MAAEEIIVGRLVRGRTRRRVISVGLVLVVLLGGGGATWLASSVVLRGQKQLSEQAMTRAINDSADAVSDEVGHFADALEDVAAAIGSSTYLSKGDFEAITEPLDADRLPGASSIGFAVPAKDGEVSATQAYWRARGAGGLTLYRTGTDIEHQFVVFMRSFTTLPATPGRDLSNTPATAEALNLARNSRSFTLGAAHISLRDRQLPVAQQQLSVTLAVPVLDQRAVFQGWVVMAVHGVDFIEAVLAGRLGRGVNLRLVDPDPGVNRTILSYAGGVPLREPDLNRSRSLVLGHRTWRLDLEPTTALLGPSDRRIGRLTPYVGGAFTLLLALLVGVLAGGRNRAMDRVDRATAALRKDIERRQAVEQELHRRELSAMRELAFHDQLTGLANRALFYDRVAHALRSHSRNAGTFAVFFIDLDGFKEVNDEHGHSAGDIVLKETAARLRDCLRDSDTVARFGGDEFAVMVERLADADDVHVTAGRMVASLGNPIRIGARTVAVTASIGVALNRPGDDTEAILRAADLAMYEAKTSGKSRHVLSGS